MTIPLTSKTLGTHRIIRRLTYFFSRFINVVNLTGIILTKISKFSSVLISCPYVIVSKEISEVLGKVIFVAESSSSNLPTSISSTDLRAIDLDLLVLDRSNS